MNRKEFSQFFVDVGWKKTKCAGSEVLSHRDGDKRVWFVVILNSNKYLDISPNLTNDAFDVACNVISADQKKIDPSIICQTALRETKEGFDGGDAARYSTQIITWAIAADIDSGLAALRALPTSCPGAMPVRHMAALAVGGDVKTLTYYRESFAKGDRLDFVPYVDIDMIDRALDFARQRRDNPEWLPTTPKLRV